MPKIAVSLANTWSIPLLFPPKKVSAPPAIDPESPALLPDCKTTDNIKHIASIASITLRAVITIILITPHYLFNISIFYIVIN